MSSYTIKSGENLWNIVKSQYKLSNNTEIANKVNEIAKANNIKNANMIFAGQKINLDMGLTIEHEEKKKDIPATDPIKMTQAQMAAKERIGYNNIKSYNDLNTLAQSSVSIFGADTKTEEQKNTAYQEYSQYLLNEYYDENKDGKVTVEEFTNVEYKGAFTTTNLQGQKMDNDIIAQFEQDPEMLKFYDENSDGKISQEEYKKGLEKLNLTPSNNEELNNTIAQRSSNLFARNLDINNDGTISKEELAFFNKNADEMDGTLDGVITNSGESGMFMAITGMNANDVEINRVVNKYLTGQTLTADEQKILERSTNIIRTNMAKAAGINIEG